VYCGQNRNQITTTSMVTAPVEIILNIIVIVTNEIAYKMVLNVHTCSLFVLCYLHCNNRI